MPKRILVPLDKLQPAEPPLDLATDLARGGDAVIRLLHVAPVPDNVVDLAGRVVSYADQEMERLEAEWLDYVQGQRLRLEAPRLEGVLRFGDPLKEILAEVESFKADLIVMSTRARSPIGLLVLGSVAEQVLRRAAAPVALVRAMSLERVG